MILKARGRMVIFPRRPLVMGIVNINDDSFCGDGTLDVSAAMAKAKEMVRQGADIIDAGAESARTNRGAITIQEEIDRLFPFVSQWLVWRDSLAGSEAPVHGQLWPPLLSVNTWRPEVVAAVLESGGDLLNDIGGLPDDRNARLCAKQGAALLIMHSQGLPKEKHTHVHYPDIMATLDAFFADRIRTALVAGVEKDSLVLDPGIDFAKQAGDNLTILREMERLHRFHRPILLPVSRKSVIGKTLDLPDPLDRDPGTIACLTAGHQRGAAILRVHNVEAAVSSLRVLEAVAGSA